MRSDLSRSLATLMGFSRPDPYHEQVPTPSESASGLLWEALLRGDITGRRVADLGSGPGILAIGAALLGAKSVIGIESDKEAMTVARENAKSVGCPPRRIRWIEADVKRFLPLKVETALMNPPFGIQKRGAERPFLRSALAMLLPEGALYFFASPRSQTFIEELVLTQAIRVEDHARSAWPFPPTFRYHRQRMGRVMVDRWILRLEKRR